MELSETVIEKYQHQSEIVSASFLLSGLNILNQADVQYRISKNKRLHVELALLKLCYIHGAIHTYQTEGALPEKKTPVVNAPKQFASEKLKAETTSEEKAEYIPEKKKEISHSAETVSMPKKGSLRQNILNKNSEVSAENKEEIKLDKKTVIPELFIMAWKEYADNIRSDLQRVAVLMDHAVLTFSNEAEISIGLDSQVEINIMQTHITDLKSFLYDAIDNNTFDIQLNVIEKTKTAKRPYTAIEKFKKMAEVNPLIQEIKDTLGFELDY